LTQKANAIRLKHITQIHIILIHPKNEKKEPSPTFPSVPNYRMKVCLPFLILIYLLTLRKEELASIEEEFRDLQREIGGRLETMKKEVEYFKNEVHQRHLQNMHRIQQMDELLGTFAPGLISFFFFFFLLEFSIFTSLTDFCDSFPLPLSPFFFYYY
jgi:hypothetical protein